MSCESVNDNLYGDWAVFEIFYNDQDITGINRDVSFQRTLSMAIDKSTGIIFLPIDSNEDRKIGHIRAYRKGDDEYLEIFNADDSRFNEIYLIHLESVDQEASQKQKQYRLILESKNMYIYAEKIVTSFPQFLKQLYDLMRSQ